MPPAFALDKNATSDPANSSKKTKKTKSRNGCGRCKLKRLKCDETPGKCLQCEKRGIRCPGYEKTLKWSTKYEVLQPTLQWDVAHQGGDAALSGTSVNEVLLPPDVVSGFEALAAVLPSVKQRSEAIEEVHASPDQPDQSPESSEQLASATPHSTPDEQVFPLEFQDPLQIEPLADDSLDVDEEFGRNLSFDGLETITFADECAISDNLSDVEELWHSQDDTSSVGQPSPRLSRSLLLDYYRLPSPSPRASLDDMESMLVQHYFKDVCVLFSSFDSVLNPYRTTIGRIFQGSSSIYYAIQSMAAAHLANIFPNMTNVGIDMQRKACECLQTELPLVQRGQINGTTTFLSIILLGMTTSWHESSALGEEFLTTARSLILPKLLSSSEKEEVHRETQFFEESLIYWEMLMGYVTQDSLSFSGSGLRSRMMTRPAPAARNREGKIVPHPWTGIAPTIQFLFAEVGRLVRKERILAIFGGNDPRQRQENLLNAATLEEDLLAAEYPVADDLADPGDARTSKRDFIVIAESYRRAGLLELYRVFPSTLRKRLGLDKHTWTEPLDFECPTPRFETPYEDLDTKLWLNSLALHILGELETLPSSSGTCCLQPILFVSAASELKYVSSVDFFDVTSNDVKVQRARDFALKRLEEYSMRLPGKPIRKCINLVGEAWLALQLPAILKAHVRASSVFISSTSRQKYDVSKGPRFEGYQWH
ncbi:hypothetical protein BU24DRAFT_457700 [Aaosphaeria arxii CBS 175.79]|uniref:Zn(2)-C6 fungal-type domain-containing protein n=1 Tax=Aaosphaeria arxii CBS 175.79 TaxID=1450172 RepID=A0A6A5Y8U9_9PLEO|nr:uncharacterized protein BU24DRAFT_457700 [Aaosphaeria arxii CBS 175.79]KAF2021759.1 hypothetical protein BU24DRAFT_457700 [Aaosphaeria arxii CBS 175.79]